MPFLHHGKLELRVTKWKDQKGVLGKGLVPQSLNIYYR